MTVTTTFTSGTLVATETIYPLTTTFTPPAACSGIRWDETSEIWAVNEVDSSTCLPTGFALSQASYFSPGLDCPAGYFTACHNAAQGTTTVTCCPVVSGVSMLCKATITDSAFTSQWCTWSAGDGTTTITATSNGTTQPIGFTSRDGFNAWAVRLVYEASDLTSGATTTTAGTADGAASTATSPAGAASTSASSSSSSAGSTPSGGDEGGLSAGAAAGIGIAVAVVTMAGIAGAFLCWRRRRQRGGSRTARRPPEGLMPPELPPGQQRQELGDNNNNGGGGGGDDDDDDKAALQAGASPAGGVSELYVLPHEMYTQPPEFDGGRPAAGRPLGAQPSSAYEMAHMASPPVRYELPS